MNSICRENKIQEQIQKSMLTVYIVFNGSSGIFHQFGIITGVDIVYACKIEWQIYFKTWLLNTLIKVIFIIYSNGFVSSMKF